VTSGHFKIASLSSVYDLMIITHDTYKKVVLYGCETWYRQLTKEYTLRVMDNNFVPDNGGTVGWRQ
jgi:hypothetical protein